jgi:small GTP-binding protein
MDSTNHQGHVSTDGLVKPVVVWKIMIGGKGAVGKTTIIKRYLSGEFCGNTMMTIGVQFHIQELKRRGCTIKLSLWDLGGQERFQFLLPNYCEGASGGIVLFAMNDLETLDDALTWVSMFRSRFTSNVPIILVGTKLDLVDPSQ